MSKRSIRITGLLMFTMLVVLALMSTGLSAVYLIEPKATSSTTSTITTTSTTSTTSTTTSTTETTSTSTSTTTSTTSNTRTTSTTTTTVKVILPDYGKYAPPKFHSLDEIPESCREYYRTEGGK